MRTERAERICDNDGTRYLVSDVSIFQVHNVQHGKDAAFLPLWFVYLSDCMPHTYIKEATKEYIA